MPAPRTIDLKTRNSIEVGWQVVSTAPRWADAWVEQPYLHCLEAIWSAAPTLPTATLVFDYGLIRKEDSIEFKALAKKTGLSRGVVKIEFFTHQNAAGEWQSKTWYGFIELEVDDLLGTYVDATANPKINQATGHQTFVCYGLEWPLTVNTVERSFFKNNDGDPVFTARRIPFNSHNKGNATPIDVGDSRIFTNDLTDAEKWNSDSIVKYLLARQSPRDKVDELKIPYVLDGAATLPKWDTPQLDQEDATTYSLVTRLVDRRRLVIGWFDYDADNNRVVLKTNTMTNEDIAIDLPGADPVPANSSPLILVCDEDQLTDPRAVKDSDVQRYDRIVCLGDEEQSVGSFSVQDGTLVRNWKSEHETAYNDGASLGDTYAAASKKEKQRRNADARAVPKLSKVYCSFKIPLEWNGKVKDGEAGDENPLFPNPDPDLDPWPFYYPETFIQNNLPLWKGTEYANDAIATGIDDLENTEGSAEELEPLVFFKRIVPLNPDYHIETWIRGEDMGHVAIEHLSPQENFHFSVHVHVPPRSHAVEVRVGGDMQHAIATDIFVPLPVDKKVGQYKYSDGMILTLCLSSGRRVQGAWPPDPPANLDHVRTLEIHAGDYYKSVYVAPGTVVGVDQDGFLKRSTGGYIPATGATDAPTQLTALAKLAHAWYSAPHKVLTLETHQLRSDIGVGDMIQQIGDQRVDGGGNVTLNSPVTELRISWPRGTPDSTPAPTMQITTWAGELEPTSVAPIKVKANDGEAPAATKPARVWAPYSPDLPDLPAPVSRW
jgi:hypothetical protein